MFALFFRQRAVPAGLLTILVFATTATAAPAPNPRTKEEQCRRSFETCETVRNTNYAACLTGLKRPLTPAENYCILQYFLPVEERYAEPVPYYARRKYQSIALELVSSRTASYVVYECVSHYRDASDSDEELLFTLKNYSWCVEDWQADTKSCGFSARVCLGEQPYAAASKSGADPAPEEINSFEVNTSLEEADESLLNIEQTIAVGFETPLLEETNEVLDLQILDHAVAQAFEEISIGNFGTSVAIEDESLKNFEAAISAAVDGAHLEELNEGPDSQDLGEPINLD